VPCTLEIKPAILPKYIVTVRFVVYVDAILFIKIYRDSEGLQTNIVASMLISVR